MSRKVYNPPTWNPPKRLKCDVTPKFGPLVKILQTHTTEEPSINGSQVTSHVLPSSNWLCQLRNSYIIYIQWVWWRLYPTVQKTASARTWPYANALRFHKYQKGTVFKRGFLPLRKTISRHWSIKIWSYESLFVIPVCARLFSFMWDLHEKQLRKEGILSPRRNFRILCWTTH